MLFKEKYYYIGIRVSRGWVPKALDFQILSSVETYGLSLIILIT